MRVEYPVVDENSEYEDEEDENEDYRQQQQARPGESEDERRRRMNRETREAMLGGRDRYRPIGE